MGLGLIYHHRPILRPKRQAILSLPCQEKKKEMQSVRYCRS